MPGFSNADNKFGPTPFIVDPVLGNGATYSTIQSAIDAAFATGVSQTVYVRPSDLGYTENLTFRNRVSLVGIQPTSFISNTFNSEVVITGNHIANSDPDGGGMSMTTIRFVNSGPGSIIDIQGVSATTLVMKDCSMFNDTGKGITSAASSFVYIFNCYFDTTDITFDNSNDQTLIIDGGTYQCDSTYVISNPLAVQSNCRNCFFSSPTSVAFVDHGGIILFDYCQFESTDSCAIYGGSGLVQMYHCTVASSDASGFFVKQGAGSGGSLVYADVINTGPANGIDPAITPTVRDWKPYATAAAAPGTAGVKGTATYDNAQFTVSDGFVQGVPGAFLMPWLDIDVDTTALPNTGYFATALGGAVVLTLPAAPPNASIVCFASDGLTTAIIQAPGTAIIHIGISNTTVGGTATGTPQYSSICLMYRANQDFWTAIPAPQGNWGLT